MWLYQNLVSNLITMGIVALGGVALGVLRKKKPEWAPIVLYGVVGAVCVAILFFSFTGRPVLSKSLTTTDNIEDNVKQWVAELGVGISKSPAPPDTYFSYMLTLKNGNPIIVGRGKEKENYLQIQTIMVLSPEHQGIFAKLSKEDQESVAAEVILELARSKMGYTIMGPQPATIQNIVLSKGIPITGNLNQASFAAAIDEMDSTISLVHSATALALARHQHGVTLPLQ